MDLAQLRTSWKLFQEEIIADDFVAEHIIRASIHQKSQSEIAKIKRGLRMKFIFACIAVIFSVTSAFVSFLFPAQFNPLDAFFSPIESTLFFSVIAISIGTMVVYNFRAYRKIRALQHSSYDLKNNLKVFIEAMNTAMTFNIFSDALMTPVIFTWMYYAFAYQEHNFTLDVRGLILILLPLFSGVFAYFFQKRMQWLKFGSYIDKLKEYLETLEKNDAEM